MKRVCLIFAIVLCVAGASWAANDFTNSYVLISTSPDRASGSDWYTVYKQSGSTPALNGVDFGSFEKGGETSLYFYGAVGAYTNLNSANYIQSMTVYYRVYEEGTTAPEYSSQALSSYQAWGSGSTRGGRYTINGVDANSNSYLLDLTDGLEAGDYIFEVYIAMAYYGGGNQYKTIGGPGNGTQTSGLGNVPNPGTIAYFTITDSSGGVVPEPGTMALLGLGAATLWGRRKI